MKLKVTVLAILLSTVLVGVKISADSVGSASCQAPYYIPSGCNTPYVPGKSPGYTADLNCQLVRITKPGTPEALCCPNICVDANGDKQTGSGADVVPEVTNLEVFNTTIRINPNNAGTIINILFTTVLGLVSVYAIVRGLYVTGVKRAMAITPDQIAELNQELTNLVIGVVICWGFIIVIQVVANVLGVGQLNNLDISGGESGGTVITIK